MREQAPSQARRFAPVAMTCMLGAALVASLASAPAFAGRYDRDDRNGQYYDDSSTGGDANPRTDFAQVVSTRPIYSQVQVNEPRDECRDVPVTYRERPSYSGDNTAGAVLGAVIGGVVGNQFGGGSGRAVATGLGAVVGASVGSHAGEYNGGYDRGDYARTGYQRQCQTVDDYHVENHIDGYDVAYRYHGAVYHTTMPYDPGDRIAVDVSVRPVRY
ncbi:MAG: hypothetical protein JWQ90_77 [Hydrocarboniphaga sp.]|nr:hypothetical protein [Hydrocarboniphaga sp.]